jgi:hypothetical protein
MAKEGKLDHNGTRTKVNVPLAKFPRQITKTGGMKIAAEELDRSSGSSGQRRVGVMAFVFFGKLQYAIKPKYIGSGPPVLAAAGMHGLLGSDLT